MTWIIAVWILVILPAIEASRCESPQARMVVAIDSTNKTKEKDFKKEKEVVSNVLDKAGIQYALVIYTGDNATIYKDFGEDTSHNGITLKQLGHIKSKSAGFAFEKLFALRYNHMPDCLWLLRNNERYTYPTNHSLPDNPMGYDQQIPKIALIFGGPNRESEMQKFTKFKDIQYHEGKIANANNEQNLNSIQKEICEYCKPMLPLSTPSTAVQPSFSVYIETPISSIMAERQNISPTQIERTPTMTPNDYQTLKPSVKTSIVLPLPTSTVENSSNVMEEMIQEYKRFLAYNITNVTLNNKDEVRKYIDMSSRLLLKSHVLQENIKPQNFQESIGLQILDKLEKFCVAVGSYMATSGLINTNTQIHTSNLVVGIYAVNVSSFNGLTFGDMSVDHAFVGLPSVIFEEHKHQGAGVIVVMILDPIQSFTGNNSGNNATLVGKIVTVIARPHPTQTLDPAVTLRVHHKDKDDATPSCVYWDFDKRSWSTAGCSMTDGNASMTECQCNHMTHYAVLFSFNEDKISEKHYQAMTLITYVGCSMSIVGVFLTLIVFLCLPVLKSERTRIHCNLCIAIGLSQILFLAAGSKDLVNQPIACKFYAALMFYWFMSVFTWMLIEGVHLYQMIIIAFVSRSMMKFYYAVGWGLPAVIVIIASSITYKGYGTSEFCWISTLNGTIWAFAVPAAIIILINTGVLACVLRLRVKLDQTSEVHKTVKTGARVSIVLLPLLGMTWVFGFFSVLPRSGLLFKYLFAITNSLQGFMIFLFHCIGNSEVRKEFHRKAESWYFVRTLSSNNISMATNKVTPISVNSSANAVATKK